MRRWILLAGFPLAALIALALACNGEEAPAVVSPTPLVAQTATPAAVETPTVTTYEAPPPMTIDPDKTYIATIKTEKGDIRIRLRPDIAPQHVNSFIFLAREGFYDGVTFHRVIPGFVAQGGDPTGTGAGGPGYTLPAEFSNVPFERGTVGMARTADPNSAGSQFFIAYAALPDLNGQYTVFGEVIEGMDVADALTPRDPERDPTAPPGDRMITIEIEEE